MNSQVEYSNSKIEYLLQKLNYHTDKIDNLINAQNRASFTAICQKLEIDFDLLNFEDTDEDSNQDSLDQDSFRVKPRVMSMQFPTE